MKRLFTLLLLSACISPAIFGQTNTPVVFSFDHKAGSDPMVLNQTIFPIWNNKMVVLTRAEFYISEVDIHHEDGTSMPLTDQYILVNATEPAAEFALGNWPIDAAHNITLHLGVPQSVNHNDPAAWPSTHPLSPQDPTMHWGWAAGYRFMAIEGKVDNNGDGVPETAFEFHNLGDALYKTAEITGTKTMENGILHIHYVLDYAQLFKNLSMSGNLIQHGSATINNNMMNNAATQNFISMVSSTGTEEINANSLNIKATPNPANVESLIQYTLPASGNVTLVVRNALGQTVRQVSGLPASGSTTLPTASFSSGIYYCAFYEEGKLLARKQLVINH